MKETENEHLEGRDREFDSNRQSTELEGVTIVTEMTQNLSLSQDPQASASSPVSTSNSSAPATALKNATPVLQPTAPNPDTSPPNDQFPLFTTLPTELRLNIWREALPGPRIVDVFFDVNIHQAIYSRSKDDNWDGPHILRANQPPPTIMHACHESRAEALRFYSQIGNLDSSNGLVQSNVWLDLEKDNAATGTSNAPTQT